MDFVALDFETCNFKRSSACSVAAVVVESGEIVDTFTTLIRPAELHFEPRCMRIHRIPEDDIRCALALAEIWPELESRIARKVVFAHNAAFDISVLRHSLHSCEIETCEFDYFCSYHLARVAWPGFPFYKLNYLCNRLGIVLDHHDALSDAHACASVAMLACEELEADSFDVLEAVHRMCRGRVYANQEWIAPSSPGFVSARSRFELNIPSDFDISCHPLNGKNVVVTGSLSFCTKSCAQAAIERLGGIRQQGVTKKTDVIVVGDVDAQKLADGQNITSKHQKAIQYRDAGQAIEFLDEESFLRLLTQPEESLSNA